MEIKAEDLICYIVNDEESLKEAAEALGYSVMKKPDPLVHLDLCMECGRRPMHLYSRKWGENGYEFGIKLKCKSCGKTVQKIFVTERPHGTPKREEENEIRELWNKRNKESINEG